MAIYTYKLRNQYACEECAMQMGREIKDKKLVSDVGKCGVCKEKKEIYHASRYADIEVNKK